jgi:hypothetical protein
MDQMNDNELIACIGAVTRELNRVERALGRYEADTQRVNLLGHYNFDLSQAHSLLLEEFTRRRSDDESLRPIDEYLVHFTFLDSADKTA